MENADDLVLEYTHKIGLDQSLRGYGYFVSVVTACVNNPSLFSLKRVCTQIGQAVSQKVSAVQRALYYAINSSRILTDRAFQLFGKYIDPIDMHPKRLICIVAEHVRHELAD